MIFFLFISIFSIASDINFKSKYPATIKNHSFWKQYRICFPPFNWSLPGGLTPETEKLFWVQSENMRHFLDTNNTDHCGVVRVVKNGAIDLPFERLSNVTHFINDKRPPKQIGRPEYITSNITLVLSGHWGHYFQHFFDNIGPQLVLALDATGLDPKDVDVVVDTSLLFENVPLLWKRMGFHEVTSVTEEIIYYSKYLVYVESAPKVHPHFCEGLRNLLKIPHNTPSKIIYISRKMRNSYYNQRFILNDDKLVALLQTMFGKKNFVAFDHKSYTLEQTIQLFSQAKVIIGSHGGGLYNQFFAPKDATVIEIMPVRPNGLYPDQRSGTETPSFSHMAVWSNTLLIGQRFYRYYETTLSSNFYLNLAKFENFLSNIPELWTEDEL